MSKKVLIIGNGKSRLKYQEFIANWKDEIWACNATYLEFHNGSLPRLDILLCDFKVLPEVIQYKKKYGGKYIIFGKNQKATTQPGVTIIDVPRKFIGDSGSTLVARALDKGYDEIQVVGFDLGGADIYVKGHEDRNKEKWVRNWRQIAKEWGLEKIHFVGYDHKEFILSDQNSDLYATLYMNGYNHIEYLQTQGITAEIRENKVLILGNGVSRKNESVINQIKNWKGELWVCNEAYKEYKDFPIIDRIGTVHEWIAFEAIDFKEKNNLSYQVYVRDIIEKEKYKNKVKYFKDKRGWSTGNLMIIQALYDKYKEIVLAGYDFGGADVYQETDRPGGNFSKQFKAIQKEFGMKNFRFIGKQPDCIL